MHIPAHIQQPATVSTEEWLWFWHELDRALAQIRRERNWRYGHPCQPLRRPKPRRRHPRI
ncbi:MAG: hypothetical protein CYG59_11620 [Chloroflexi bacterium]|nr:MAG: hypothetical protein CYG59_11620 [Chloroflexota bacterium]